MTLGRWFGSARLIAAAVLLAPPAIAPAAALAKVAAPAVHPLSGLPVIGLTISHGARVRHFRVELATTAQQQAMGLMFRRSMGPDEGMLFPKTPPQPASFWMRNTLLPLDLVFIGADGRILAVAHGAPLDETPIDSHGLVKAVLELNAGRSAALGLGAGDKVRW